MNSKRREAVAAFKVEATRTQKQAAVLAEAREVSMKAQQVAKSAQSIVETFRKDLTDITDDTMLNQFTSRLKKQSKALEPMQRDVEDVWYRLDKKLSVKFTWKWQ